MLLVNILSVVLVVLVSFICFIIARILKRKFKISEGITYIVIGFIFGAGGLGLFSDKLFVFGNLEYFPVWSRYSLTMLFLFFLGMGLNFKLNFKKIEYKTIYKLMSVPVYFEILIMSLVGYVLVNLVIEINFFEALLIASFYAMASPINISHATITHLKNHRNGENKIAFSTLEASAIDNLSPLFVIALILPLASTGSHIGTNLMYLLLGMIIIVVIGIVCGMLISKVMKNISFEIKNGKVSSNFYILCAFTLLVLCYTVLTFFNAFGVSVALFGIMGAFCMGSVIATSDHASIYKKLSYNSIKLFNIFGYPIIFLGIGSRLDIVSLISVPILIYVLIFMLLAIFLKVSISYVILIRNDYNIRARRYTMSAFIIKGVSLLTSLLILSNYTDISENVISVMRVIGTLSIIISLPIGLYLLNKNGKKWLM